MSLTVHFSTRDFSSPILTGLHAEPIRLDWSAYGGPEKAQIQLTGDQGKLIEVTRLLRSPVLVDDPAGSPVWWGYVEQVLIFLDSVQFEVSLDRLFNKVSVRYTFTSPGNHSEEALMTAIANDLASQREYGIREIVINRDGIDDDFADNLRDTFLKAAAWPKSTLTHQVSGGQPCALVRCAGWFNTLAWQHYDNDDGFYANTGPGPGTFSFGQSASYRCPSQSFTPGASGNLKYAYFQLRGVGSPTRDLNAQLRDGMGTILGVSEGVSGATLSNSAYAWVKFTFASPVSLTGGTTYLIGVTANTTNPSQYFAVRTDENQGYSNGNGCYFNGVSWVSFPSVTNPGGAPDLLFRAVCITDTGTQITAIANDGNQFFTRIRAFDSGVLTCPYRNNGCDCLKEIRALMTLGTSNQRKILANVTVERALEFYEQPDSQVPSIYMDEKGVFYTFQGTALRPYFPPIGKFAIYSGSGRMMQPFDKNRVPACFIESAVYWPKTGKVQINQGRE